MGWSGFISSSVSTAREADVVCSLIMIALFQTASMFLRRHPTTQTYLHFRLVLAFLGAFPREKFVNSPAICDANIARFGLNRIVLQIGFCRHLNGRQFCPWLLRRTDFTCIRAERTGQSERRESQNHFGHDSPKAQRCTSSDKAGSPIKARKTCSGRTYQSAEPSGRQRFADVSALKNLPRPTAKRCRLRVVFDGVADRLAATCRTRTGQIFMIRDGLRSNGYARGKNRITIGHF